MENQDRKTRPTARLITFAVIGLLAGFIANWMISQKSPSSAPKIQLENATALFGQTRPLAPFTLMDQDGQPFGNERLQGRWSFFFFGYTHCPDVCPTTLVSLNEAMNKIATTENAKAPQVIFISVDPDRDDTDRLKGYVEYFNPDFLGLTGTPAAINVLTSTLGILHIKTPNPNDPQNYLVDHTATVLLINPKGELLALFGAPHHADKIAADFNRLRTYYEEQS